MANADTQTNNQEGLGGALSKFDKDTLGAMQPSQQTGAMFVPSTMGEAMELSKLMAAGRFVPPHLRGKRSCIKCQRERVRQWRQRKSQEGHHA